MQNGYPAAVPTPAPTVRSTAMGTVRQITLVIALSATIGLLTGCTNTTDPGRAQPSASPSPESTADNGDSTVEQWASLIAAQRADWDGWHDDWDEMRCSSIEANLEGGLLCNMKLLSASFMAQTTAIEYEIATTPGRPDFIAEEPPREISRLFERTVVTSADLREAADAWTAAGCDSGPSDGCGGLAFNFESAIDDLRSEYSAWSPYLGG